MLNVSHFRQFVVVPALAVFPEEMRTPAAVELLIGTGLKESGLEYLKQGLVRHSDGRGRALGLYQMEPITCADHCRWLSAHPELECLVYPHGPCPPTDMQGDLYLATRMARIHYWCRGQDALPDVSDVEGMAAYWGRYWQTQSIPEQMAQYVRLYNKHALPSRPKGP
jgi:hypothetical protein